MESMPLEPEPRDAVVEKKAEDSEDYSHVKVRLCILLPWVIVVILSIRYLMEDWERESMLDIVHMMSEAPSISPTQPITLTPTVRSPSFDPSSSPAQSPSPIPTKLPTYEANKHPIYLYMAGIEGVGHHGVIDILEPYLKLLKYKVRAEDSLDERNGNTNCKGSDDTWLLDLIKEWRDWNPKSPVPVYIRGTVGSFPACTGPGRLDLQKLIEAQLDDPLVAIDSLLHYVQRRRHPTSLLQHASFSENLIQKNYDFKVIWLQRDFLHSVYSRFSDWKLDDSIFVHAVMLGLYELYIATEIRDMELAGLGSCVKLYTDVFGEAKGKASALQNISRLVGKDEMQCDKCWEHWQPSKKDPYKNLELDEIAYIQVISDFIEEIKESQNICVS